MVKVTVNNFDYMHYSALSKAAKQYIYLKKCCLVTGAAFIAVSAVTVLMCSVEHKFDGVMLIAMTFALALFIGFVIQLAKMDPVRGFRDFQVKSPNYRFTIAFDNEEFFLDASTDFSENHTRYKYPRLISAAEADGFFIIGIESTGSAVFSEGEFTEGTPDELRALLSSKLGAKYRRK